MVGQRSRAALVDIPIIVPNPTNMSDQSVHGQSQLAARPLIVLGKALIPASTMQNEATTTLGRLRNRQSPSIRNLVVGIVLMMVVLFVIPVGQFVDDFCSAVEELKRVVDLLLDRWKELRNEIGDGISQTDEGLPDSGIGVIRT